MQKNECCQQGECGEREAENNTSMHLRFLAIEIC